ncbi:MAG: amylo-alpha-1,6-glucosidase [Acidobacteria bacterium]|nr:amylo-alpha-1,6-glucosidase [Acidobacteriota bacterium]
MQRAFSVGIVVLVAIGVADSWTRAQGVATTRFSLTPSGLALTRGLTTGAFFDVLGRRSALFGYEGRPAEIWVYPLKVLDRLQLSFVLEGYPLAVPASELRGTIEVRPEATIFTASHAAFTVRQIMFAPIDEPAVVVLLDIDTTLPMTVIGSFRPSLRPMWPAGAATVNAAWDTGAHVYDLSEESGRFAGVVGVPGGVDRSVMPYQEEPRDVPLEFALDVSLEKAARELFPIVVTADAAGRAAARTTYTRVLENLDALYRSTAQHYARLLERTVDVATPEARLDRAFDWARVGMDKGMATNPTLGTGLVAGFRTSGNSERPGFAWFFGRDALWTALALTASGNTAEARTALAFLAGYQRDDGKIPHEISQSASLVPWFTDYPYAWASADATPLYVIAHADAWRAGGDRAFLARHWSSLQRAYRFSAATDADGNGLIENTGAGHGWVEGGALYPPHEEIYLQGLWIQASRSFAELATEMGDPAAADAARGAAERTRLAVEATYWIPGLAHYAFATVQARSERPIAEPGPARERRQRRLEELANRDRRPAGVRGLVDEDTVLPSVPMWWRTLDPARADQQLDRVGSGALATDWGHRILSDKSLLYDPLSYHYGSVWPLFTGWASMAAYRYGRPHVGYQALLANALLTESGALGYVTELLSGDFNAPFGRSSHHQVWSEAMVVSPLVRGLLGIEPLEGGRTLRIAPQLPPDWERAAARGVVSGGRRLDVEVSRTPAVVTMRISPAASLDRARDATEPVEGSGAPGVEPVRPALLLAPALPLDAVIDRVVIDGKTTRPRMIRLGDVQFVEVAVAPTAGPVVAEFRYRGGSDVYTKTPIPALGARNEGLRILRSRAEAEALRLLLEGRTGRSYDLFLRTPRQIGALHGATLVSDQGPHPLMRVTFAGDGEGYMRREVVVELSR